MILEILREPTEVHSSPEEVPSSLKAQTLLPPRASELVFAGEQLPDILAGPYGSAVFSEITEQVTPITTAGMLLLTRDIRAKTLPKRSDDYLVPETGTVQDYAHDAMLRVLNAGGSGPIALERLKQEQYELIESGKHHASSQLNPIGIEIMAAMNAIAIATGSLQQTPRQLDRRDSRARKKLLSSYGSSTKNASSETSIETVESAPNKTFRSHATKIGAYVTRLFK